MVKFRFLCFKIRFKALFDVSIVIFANDKMHFQILRHFLHKINFTNKANRFTGTRQCLIPLSLIVSICRSSFICKGFNYFVLYILSICSIFMWPFKEIFIVCIGWRWNTYVSKNVLGFRNLLLVAVYLSTEFCPHLSFESQQFLKTLSLYYYY